MPKMKRAATSGPSVHRRGDRRRPEELKDKTEEDALIAYLQGLGTLIKEELTWQSIPCWTVPAA
jgi:cytochrome c oxidase cbb3-type subunit 2